MPFYNLKIIEDGRDMSSPAANMDEALYIFGKELGKVLTLEQQDAPAPYLMDEWVEQFHWVYPHIPVYER